jgi:NifB/MoaA-like Fe-S oxidoreductase
MGKIGNDAFGKMVQQIVEQYGGGGLLVDESVSTSYSVVLAVPGIDRIFLHNPGANDSFCCQDIPEEDEYEDYPQIENGVGMIRQFKEECRAAYFDVEKANEYRDAERIIKVIIPTGVSVQPHIQEIADNYAPPWLRVEVVPVKNRFFGDTITVTGLIVGRDLVDTLKERDFDRVLISESMLRENSEIFLDDMTLAQVREEIGKPITVVENNGESFIRALYTTEDEND